MLPFVLAYLDPGSGAIILQVLFAAMLTGGIMFRKLITKPWRMVARLWRRPVRPAKDSASEPTSVSKDDRDSRPSPSSRE